MLDFQDFEVIDSQETPDGTRLEVVQYPVLQGSAGVRTAQNLFYANQSGMRLKMLRIHLNNSAVRIEPGALYFMKGQLAMEASTGGGLLKGLARKAVSGERLFINLIRGTGEIYLEPTFGHFFLHKLEEGEAGVIADKGLFYAGSSGLDISIARQKNVSSALFGGEGYFQTKITGQGVVAFISPVPRSEIVRYELENEKLWVDGNFALMRSEQILFRAEKSSKSWISTSVSGEGLLQTFEGTGFVYLAPTHGVYTKLAQAAAAPVQAVPTGSTNTKTKTRT